MWTTHDLGWQTATEQAWQAYCAGSIPIGACITTADGQQVLAVGRNQNYNPPQHWVGDYHPLAHAEMMALTALDFKAHTPVNDLVLTSSLEPCPMCFGAWYMSGLRHLRYAARDPWAGATHLLNQSDYLAYKSVLVHGPHPDLELYVAAMALEWFMRNRPDVAREHPYFVGHRQKLPQAVTLAEHLLKNDLLPLMAELNAPISEVFFAIAKLNEDL